MPVLKTCRSGVHNADAARSDFTRRRTVGRSGRRLALDDRTSRNLVGDAALVQENDASFGVTDHPTRRARREVQTTGRPSVERGLGGEAHSASSGTVRRIILSSLTISFAFAGSTMTTSPSFGPATSVPLKIGVDAGSSATSEFV